MRAVSVTLALSALGGCYIPEKQPATNDAQQGGPFDCLGAPLPTKAEMQVTIAGHVIDPFTGTPAPGATIQAFLVGVPQSPIFTTMSDATGAYSQDQGTGSTPKNAYLKVTLNGFVTTYLYPPAPIVRDFPADIQVLTNTDLQTLSNVAEVAIDSTKGLAFVAVSDCNGTPLSGATITTTPPATIRYFAEGAPVPAAVATDMTGIALIFNVQPGNTTIGAAVLGMTLRSHNFDTVAGALMQTEVQP